MEWTCHWYNDIVPLKLHLMAKSQRPEFSGFMKNMTIGHHFHFKISSTAHLSHVLFKEDWRRAAISNSKENLGRKIENRFKFNKLFLCIN